LSTIAPISTKEAITSHLKSLNIKKHHIIIMFETQVLIQDRHKNVIALSHLMISQPSPF
jgi:hypothetical protein